MASTCCWLVVLLYRHNPITFDVWRTCTTLKRKKTSRYGVVISENIVPIERECSLRADQVIILCTLLQDYIRIGLCLLFLSSDDFQNVSKSIDKYLHAFSVITIIIRRSTIVLRVSKYRTYTTTFAVPNA